MSYCQHGKRVDWTHGCPDCPPDKYEIAMRDGMRKPSVSDQIKEATQPTKPPSLKPFLVHHYGVRQGRSFKFGYEAAKKAIEEYGGKLEITYCDWEELKRAQSEIERLKSELDESKRKLEIARNYIESVYARCDTKYYWGQLGGVAKHDGDCERCEALKQLNDRAVAEGKS